MQAYLENTEETLNRAQSSLPLVWRRPVLMGADRLAAGYCGTAMHLLPEFKFLSNFPHFFPPSFANVASIKTTVVVGFFWSVAGESSLAAVGPVHLSAARLLSPSPLLLSARRITC